MIERVLFIKPYESLMTAWWYNRRYYVACVSLRLPSGTAWDHDSVCYILMTAIWNPSGTYCGIKPLPQTLRTPNESWRTFFDAHFYFLKIRLAAARNAMGAAEPLPSLLRRINAAASLCSPLEYLVNWF